ALGARDGADCGTVVAWLSLASSSFVATRLAFLSSGWPSGRRISSSPRSAITASPPSAPALPEPNGDTPVGGATANFSSACSVSRCTVRTLHRSYLNDSAEDEPTPTITPFQSSPLVLSTIAQPSSITCPPFFTATR